VLGWELGDKALTAYILGRLGRTALNQSELNRAIALLEESLTVFEVLGDTDHLLEVLSFLAGATQAMAKPVRAIRLFGAAQGLREATGLRVQDTDPCSFSERFLTAARSQIEEEMWKRTWQEERTMTIEDAVTYAFGDQGVHPRSSKEENLA
jgi:hypothetical protein